MNELILPKISIIVPVYNAEPYLADCLNSILAQTFTDFELIIVNDGSLDNSGNICDEYAERDNRIQTIHKRRGGASSSRNAGLRAAKGQYIGWVDADDRIAPDMFETLYNLIKEYKADIAECQYYELRNGKSIRSGSEESIVSGDGDFIMKEFFAARMKPSLCNKLYSKNIWSGVEFPPGRNHQDFYVNVYFSIKPLVYVRTSQSLYYYIIRANSITTTRTARELRETFYKYEYTMSLADDPTVTKSAKRYLKRDAINRLMGRYFDVATNGKIQALTSYNAYLRRILGFRLLWYLFYVRIPLKTKVSYSLMVMNLLNVQKALHNCFGKRN